MNEPVSTPRFIQRFNANRHLMDMSSRLNNYQSSLNESAKVPRLYGSDHTIR